MPTDERWAPPEPLVEACRPRGKTPPSRASAADGRGGRPAARGRGGVARCPGRARPLAGGGPGVHPPAEARRLARSCRRQPGRALPGLAWPFPAGPRPGRPGRPRARPRRGKFPAAGRARGAWRSRGGHGAKAGVGAGGAGRAGPGRAGRPSRRWHRSCSTARPPGHPLTAAPSRGGRRRGPQLERVSWHDPDQRRTAGSPDRERRDGRRLPRPDPRRQEHGRTALGQAQRTARRRNSPWQDRHELHGRAPHGRHRRSAQALAGPRFLDVSPSFRDLSAS